jgi:hypothetical protein
LICGGLRPPTLRKSNSLLLVPTGSTSGNTWQPVNGEAQQKNKNGSPAYLELVSDPTFDHASWQAVKTTAPANDQGVAELVVARSTALTSPHHAMRWRSQTYRQQSTVPLHPPAAAER